MSKASLYPLERVGEKDALPKLRQAFEVAESQTFGLVNLVFFLSNWYSQCEHLFIDKPMVITQPAVPSTWLLTLQVPSVTNIYFLLTISIHYQKKRLGDLIK